MKSIEEIKDDMSSILSLPSSKIEISVDRETVETNEFWRYGISGLEYQIISVDVITFTCNLDFIQICNDFVISVWVSKRHRDALLKYVLEIFNCELFHNNAGNNSVFTKLQLTDEQKLEYTLEYFS